ncbi:Aminomethyltransferase folate-binding domain-containing protein [Mycena latifolia]|nr:Aminomethyltransferase folate-binding domain-containing protein [Mycena latifolia]
MKFRGSTATVFLEWLTPSSLSSLQPYTSTLSELLNNRGGIIDDTIITKHAKDAFYVFKLRLAEWNADEVRGTGPVEMEPLEDWGLLALQVPEAASYLQLLASFDLKTLTFGKSAFLPIKGFNLHVARGGYTGADGFEISIPPQTVEGAKIFDPKELLGTVTSGIPSPTLGKNIAMGYVLSGWHKKSIAIEIEVRGDARGGGYAGARARCAYLLWMSDA